MATTPTAPGRVRADNGPGPARQGHIGRIVAGSLATGLFAAVLLVLAPFVSPDENHVTGAVTLRIRGGVGDVGGPLYALHRSTPAVGGGTCAGDGRQWCPSDRGR